MAVTKGTQSNDWLRRAMRCFDAAIAMLVSLTTLWLMPHELELVESRRFGNGDWDLRVRDSEHRLYRVEMTVHGEILEQRLLDEIPLEYGDIELEY